MEDKKTVFNYIGQMFSIYGVMIMIFIVINLIIGNEAGSVSTLFSLGSAGLSMATLLELFLLVLIVTAAQNIFLTDILIKNLALIVRNILFFATILIAITAFAVVFGSGSALLYLLLYAPLSVHSSCASKKTPRTKRCRKH